jgi:hypothetical protein
MLYDWNAFNPISFSPLNINNGETIGPLPPPGVDNFRITDSSDQRITDDTDDRIID